MELKLVSWTLCCLIESMVWVSAYWLVPVRFFGVSAKPSKSRRYVFLAAVLLGALLCIPLYVFCVRNGMALIEPDIGVGLFCLVYWMFFLQEPGRVKRLVILLAADIVITAVMELIAHLLLFVPFFGGVRQGAVFLCCQNLLSLAAICLLSWFSQRHRREPMKFSQIVSIWVFCEMLYTVLSLFDAGGIGEAAYDGMRQPVTSARAELFSGAEDSTALALLIVAALAAALLLFFIMTVRESEARYFQKKNAVSEYYLEAQRDHYAALTESNREIRRIRHDMKNHIYCLKELYASGNYGELGGYLDAIDEGIQRADTGVHVGNEIADAIIAEKQKQAGRKGIAIEVDGTMDGVKLAAIDVCTIFANIIDNAVEAVEKLPAPDRRVHIEIRRNPNFLLISEKNPVGRKPKIRDNTILTTKRDGENHGFGLVNIKEAAARYGGECLLDASCDGDGCEFMIRVMIPLKFG